MLPPDLPTVGLDATPRRLSRSEARDVAHWEWLALDLAGGGEIAVFDPDHLCPLGDFGQPCRVALELFHPALGPNDDRRRALVPASDRADTARPPAVYGRVLAHHRYAWRYSGPVTTEERVGGAPRRVVRHVLDAPQVTLRLVLDVGRGTLLAQLRDAAEAPPVGAWVSLQRGRPELIAIAPWERA